MKTKLIFFLAFTLLFSAYAHRAEAQFWKKLFNKEEKRQIRKKPPKPKTETPEKPAAEPKTAKKKSLDFPETIMKSRYRIDVLAPLYLDELVKNDRPAFKGRIPEKAVYGLDFYEGLKLAADTLNDYGYNMDIYIHDITDSASGIERLIKRKILDSSDLLIGVVPSQYLEPLAAFAKERQINFVSALSPADADIKENPYFILLQPSFETHCTHILKVLEKKYKRKKPLVLYRTSVSMDDVAYSYFDDEIETDKKILCNSIPGYAELAPMLDSTGSNLIIMPILDVSYAEKILLKLNELFPLYKIDVLGMPSWDGMGLLKKADAFPNIAVYYTTPFYFDQTTARGQAVVNSYKNAAGNAKPSELVFRGYETIHWYANLLSVYGTIFNEKQKDNGAALFTRFDIEPKEDEERNFRYYENKHLYVFRFQSGSYMVESE